MDQSKSITIVEAIVDLSREMDMIKNNFVTIIINLEKQNKQLKEEISTLKKESE